MSMSGDQAEHLAELLFLRFYHGAPQDSQRPHPPGLG